MTSIQHQEITAKRCEELLDFYWQHVQPVETLRDSPQIRQAQENCRYLLHRDYEVIEVDISPAVCPHYPPTLLIPFKLRNCDECEPFPRPTQEELKQMLKQSSRGRVRGRFLAPTILCHTSTSECSHMSRFILRSGSLVQKPEVAWRSVKRGIQLSRSMDPEKQQEDDFLRAAPRLSNDVQVPKTKLRAIRMGDIYSMKHLGVDYVFDLMTEELANRYGVQCASSEKGKHKLTLFKEFKVVAVPFPGYEYFGSLTSHCKTLAKKNGSIHDYLEQAINQKRFDWLEQPFTKLNINDFLKEPKFHERIPDIVWDQYNTWDVVMMTTNYVRAMISMLVSPPRELFGPFSGGGLLVHCICGWDRTPVFVCLLRLTLWADGIAHPGLTPIEMLYYVIAYDWMLFGHNMFKRARNQYAELMYYAFYVLDHFSPEIYSYHFMAGKKDVDPTIRANKIAQIRKLFFEFYNNSCVLLPPKKKNKVVE